MLLSQSQCNLLGRRRREAVVFPSHCDKDRGRVSGEIQRLSGNSTLPFTSRIWAGLPEPSKWLGRWNPRHHSKMGFRSFQKRVLFHLVFNESLILGDWLEKVWNRNDEEMPSTHVFLHKVQCTQSEPVALSSFLGSAGERWDENTEAWQ